MLYVCLNYDQQVFYLHHCDHFKTERPVKDPESCDNFVDCKLFLYVQFAKSFAPGCIWSFLSGKVRNELDLPT